MTVPKENVWVARWFNIAVTIAFGVSCYLLNSTMDKINTIDKRVQILEVSAATASGNRFSTSDWMNNKALIDGVQLQNEKRITTIEQNQIAVKELLLEIKTDLKELKKEN